jgi:hypothetical protein
MQIKEIFKKKQEPLAIGVKEITRAAHILRDYRAGKRSLDARIE